MQSQGKDWKATLKEIKADLIQEEIDNAREAELNKAAREYQELSSARRLLYLAKRTGAYKGEITDITPRQFRELLGYDPKQAVVNSKGNIPWEYCFDQIATERGIAYDEELKREIEFCLRVRHGR